MGSSSPSCDRTSRDRLSVGSRSSCHRVAVTIQDGVATTRVAQAYRNDGQFPVEGTYVFPLPPGAVIQKFVLWVNGEPVVGDVLPAEEAREI